MRRVFLCGAAALTVFCAGVIVACTHDFGQFENGTASQNEAGVDGGPDAACNPDVACTDNAKKCGSDCKSTESQCEGSCGGGGGSGRFCRSNCQDAGATCDNQCVVYCMQCAGCNARSACENALQ